MVVRTLGLERDAAFKADTHRLGGLGAHGAYSVLKFLFNFCFGPCERNLKQFLGAEGS